MPTLEQCTSDSRDPSDPNQDFWESPCGLREQMDSENGNGKCSTFVSSAATAAAPGETRVVYLPPEARKNGKAIVTSKGKPYSYESHYAKGLTGSFAHLLQKGALFALRDGLDILSLPDRLAWEQNGLAVASCDEYVYERYYDYSVFEDAVAVAGDNARAVFEEAYAPGAIGDRALNGLDLASKSKKTTHDLSWFGLYPKNVYFEFDGRYPMGQAGNGHVMDADLTSRIAAAEKVPHSFQWHADMSAALAEHPDDLLYAMEEKQAEFAKHLQLRRAVFEKWQGAMKRWVDQVGACAIELPPEAVLPDPMIYINPPWESLSDLYSAGNPSLGLENPVFSTVIDASDIPEVGPDIGPDIDVTPGVPDIFTDPIFPDIDIIVTPTQPDIFTGPIVTGPIVTGPIITGPIVVGPIFAGGGAPMSASAPSSATIHVTNECLDLPDLVFDCSVGFAGALAMVNDYGVRVTKCLKVIDAEIEVELEEARAEGCLDPVGATPCDWSPRMFVRELRGRTLDGKENAYQVCQRFTGNDFGPLSLIKTAAQAGISAQDNMAKSTEHVDQFFKDVRAMANRQKFPEDPSTGKPIFGAKTADSNDIGSKDFGVKYKYDVGWKLANLDNKNVRICASEVDLNADFDVDAQIFGLKKNLVSSHSYLRTDEAPAGKQVSYQASLEILGAELLGQPRKKSVTIPMSGGSVSFPVLSERLVERRTLMESKAYFSIGPIPVSISAGAAGEVGVELSLNGEMEYACANPSQNPSGMNPNDVLRLGASGGARPYAALNAFATAAVDIVIASAGVRADLTLLNLSVPFTVAVTAGIDPQSTPNVNAKTSMKLVLETLSGRISVFIDTLFGNVLDETIFTWSGPRVEKTIVEENWNMDLRAARLDFLLGG
jgi:hypothetical protein